MLSVFLLDLYAYSVQLYACPYVLTLATEKHGDSSRRKPPKLKEAYQHLRKDSVAAE